MSSDTSHLDFPFVAERDTDDLHNALYFAAMAGKHYALASTSKDMLARTHFNIAKDYELWARELVTKGNIP